MKRKLLGLIAFLSTLNCFAQAGYIEYSENCMDRYVYQVQDSKNGDAYISYRMKMGTHQYVILEVERENFSATQTPPAGTRSCESWVINRKTVQDINDGKRKLAIVTKDRNGYYSAEVKKATFYYLVGPELEYTSKEAIFSVNLEKPVYSKNLAMEGSEQEVYLDGVDFEQCKKGFIFRKTEDVKDKDYKEFTFSPEIGILEKRSVTLNKNNTTVNIMRLKSINGKALDEVISLSCAKSQAEIFDNPTPVVTSYNNYSGRINTKPTFSTRGGTAINTTSAPCPNVSREGWHIVKTGETLYSIARRYGISLAQLRDWNGMQNSNIISPCQELKVTATASTTSNVVTRPESTFVAPPVNRGTVETATSSNTNTTNAYTGYRNTTTASTTNTNNLRPTYDKTYATGGIPAWVSAGSYHVVANGESLNSIAQMYGFTEERLRYMNGLGEREIPFVGQTLRITVCEENKSVANIGQPHPYNYETTIISPPSYSNYNETYLAPREGGVDYRVHIVQNGESIYSIARDYGTTAERILQINNMSPGEVIMQSQRIYIDK